MPVSICSAMCMGPMTVSNRKSVLMRVMAVSPVSVRLVVVVELAKTWVERLGKHADRMCVDAGQGVDFDGRELVALRDQFVKERDGVVLEPSTQPRVRDQPANQHLHVPV